jgi:hypothetical protein
MGGNDTTYRAPSTARKLASNIIALNDLARLRATVTAEIAMRY